MCEAEQKLLGFSVIMMSGRTGESKETEICNVTGYGNYAEERRELFTDQTLDDLVSQIKQRRERRTTPESSAE